MVDGYDAFLESKRLRQSYTGLTVADDAIHPMLFPFQRDITRWALRKGRAIRTKSKGLLFVQKERDRVWLRPALADYIVIFRKPGDNAVPIRDDQISNDEWISWARPIWYGVRESETLNVTEAREQADERHIAPLQLEVLRRCIRLWTNPEELVLDPFAGIGSTGYVAIENGRRFVGIELKPSYWRQAVKNLGAAQSRLTLWDGVL